MSMAEKDDGATRANGVHTNDSSPADGRNGMADDRESDEDPSTWPAVLVKGFKFSEDDPSGSSRVTSLVTEHFQKKRHGGGEVFGDATLLNKSTMRVAFEEEHVARRVLQRPQKLKTGEELRVKPEVFMHAQLVKLSPLVRLFFSAEELESLCHSCGAKLITYEEVCGSWTAIKQLEKHLSARLSLPNHTGGKKSSLSSSSSHHSSKTDNSASAKSKETGAAVRTSSFTSIRSSGVAGGSVGDVGDHREAELCSEFEGKVHLAEGANRKTADRMSRNCHDVEQNAKLSDRMDVEEPGSCRAKTQQLGQAQRRQLVRKVTGKRGLLFRGTIDIDDEKASLLRQKELDVISLCHETNCQVDYESKAIVVCGDSEASVQKAVETILSLCRHHAAQSVEEGPNNVHSALLDVGKSALMLAYSVDKEELHAIETKWNCYVDYKSEGDKVHIYASTAVDLAEGMSAMVRVCEKYANETAHAATAEDEGIYKDSMVVLPHLMMYLLKTEKDFFTSFYGHGCDCVIADDHARIQLSSRSQEALHTCVDKFITLYHTVMSEARHTTIELAPSLSPSEIEFLLKDVKRLPEMQDCIMSLNGTGTAVTFYGKRKSIQVVTEHLEEAMDQESLSFCRWRGRTAAASSTTGNATSIEADYSKATVSRATASDTAYRQTAVGNVTLEVLRGDLTKEHVDAVVNAANDQLSHYGGVAHALSQAGGPDVQSECNRKMRQRKHKPLNVGETVTTGAGELKCKCIIHVVGPNWKTTQPLSAEIQLERACVNVLETAAKQDVKSVAFPAISSGVYGMPQNTCAKVMLGAISQHCHKHKTCIQNVRIVLFELETVKAFLRRFDQMFRSQGSMHSSSCGQHLQHGGSVGSWEDADATRGAASRPANDSTALNYGRTILSNNDSLKVTVPNGDLESTNGRATSKSGCKMVQKSLHGKRKPDNPSSLARGLSPPKVSKTSRDDGSCADIDKKKSSYAEMAGKAATASGGDGAGAGGSAAAAAASAAAAAAAADADDNNCPICLCDINDERKLECGHRFCASCLDRANQSGFKACPTCRKPIGKPEGTQPRGCTMNIHRDKLSLPGYHCATIVISYHIPSGVQSQEHPNPGRHYSGDSRTAYLPDNKEGNKALRLLQKAFNARLVFTIGRSVTRGVDGVVVWNDIHHKTSRSGGPACYGYPDNTYIKRLIEDLAARGIQ